MYWSIGNDCGSSALVFIKSELSHSPLSEGLYIQVLKKHFGMKVFSTRGRDGVDCPDRLVFL